MLEQIFLIVVRIIVVGLILLTIVYLVHHWVANELWPRLTIKNNKYKLLELMRRRGSGHILRFAGDVLKNDPEVVLEAIKISGNNFEFSPLRHASFAIRANRDILVEAVKHCSIALKYASVTELQDDRELVSESVRRYPGSLRYASAELKDDQEIVLLGTDKLNWGSSHLQFASVRLRSKKEVVLMHVKTFTNALKFASELLQDDSEIVKESVIRSGNSLEYASDRLKNDWEIVMLAISEDPSAIIHASARLQAKIKSN